MITRLLSGSFEQEVKTAEGGGSVDKKCMLVYAGQFSSLDGPVDIKDDDIDQLAANHNSTMSKLGRLAEGVMPLKFSPPIQLDHSTSAKDTVGRLVGDLEVGEHTLEDGTKVKALFGTARILGKENVEKVTDGRWTHLSIGADLENHKISELTITPFPAAAEASLLSKMAKETVVKQGREGKVQYKIFKTDSGKFKVDLKIGGRSFEAPSDEEYNSIDEAMRDIQSLADDEDNMSRMAEGIELHHLKPGTKIEGKEWMLEITKEIEGEGYEAKVVSGEYNGHKAGDTFIVKETDGKVQISKGEKSMDYKSMKEKMAAYEKCRKHLSEVEKMSEEDVDKKLSEMSDDEVTSMSAAEDEREKKMSEEEDKKKAAMASLSAHAGEMTKLAKSFKETQGKVELAAKKSKLSVRLAKLKASAKITPAEMKKIDLAGLAAKDDQTVNAVFDAYEKREPLVHVGLYGSTKALTAGQLESQLKKNRMTRLELETALNMPSKREEALKRLAEMDEEEKMASDMDMAMEDHKEMADYDMAWSEACKMMDEGKMDDAKAHMKKFMDKMKMGGGAADTSIGEATEDMSTLAEEVKKMQTEFVGFVKLTAPHFGLKADELV